MGVVCLTIAALGPGCASHGGPSVNEARPDAAIPAPGAGGVPPSDASTRLDGDANLPLVAGNGGASAVAPDAGNLGDAGPIVNGGAGLSPLVATRLRCDLRVDPLQVQPASPRLTWELQLADARARTQKQTAFELIVASTADKLASDLADIWTSGTVNTSLSGATYLGPPLASFKQVFWKVRIRDGAGQTSAWSAPAKWTQGLMTVADWGAQWITGAATESPLPIFRRQFEVTKPVTRALVAICGLGQYELRVNGTNASEGVLDPGWTDFSKTCLYRTFDVTSSVVQGTNAMGVLLGNGMYHVTKTDTRYTKFTGSFGPLKLIARLRITFSDGTEANIATDASWKTSAGPLTFTNIYGGEDFDARREPAGWDHAGFNDTPWASATVVGGAAPVLVGQLEPPVKVIQEFPTVKVSEPQPGVFVYDLGQNFAGWPAIEVSGSAGAVIRLTPAELLGADGLVTQTSMGGGPIWDEYTLRGGANETWHPRFSYTGFRYVQVSNAVPTDSAVRFPNRPKIVSMKGQFISSSAEPVGTFTTSDNDVNRIHAIIVASGRSNLQSILTDCPTREKLGWMETGHLMGKALMFNLDLQAFYEQWVEKMRAAQTSTGLVPDIVPEYAVFGGDFRDSPEWGSSIVVTPWSVHQMYGDDKLVRESYSAMKRYLDYLNGKATQGFLNYGLGEWYDVGPLPPGRAQLTSSGVTATGFLYSDATIMQQAATLLGFTVDVPAYSAISSAAAGAYQAKFWNPAGYYDRRSEAAQAVPLALGIVPAANVSAATAALVAAVAAANNRATTGDVGTSFLWPALGNVGRSDVIMQIVKQKTGGGYLYQVEHGATTLTEAWDSYSHSSQNHPMLGQIERWFWEGLAGLNAEAGFSRFVVRPQMPVGIDSVQATYHSAQGLIASAWTRRAQGGVEIRVSIPVNTAATVVVPTRDPASVTESGAPLATALGVLAVHPSSDTVSVDVGSGNYVFVAN